MKYLRQYLSYSFIVIALTVFSCSNDDTVITPVPTNEIDNNLRSLYIDGFSSILGDMAAENELLTYAKSHEIDVLLLYELHLVHQNIDMTNPVTNGVLANFISKAKTDYNVTYIGAVGEHSGNFTDVIDPYNNSRSNATEKFDIYNLEFEFWIADRISAIYCTPYLTPNNLACNEDGAFDFFISSLQTIKALATANTHTITTEAYIGWTNKLSLLEDTQVEQAIAQNVDRIRVHAYRTDPTTAYGYTRDRLEGLGNGTPGLDVSIIFSAEAEFMQVWLANNSMTAAEEIFRNDLHNAPASIKDKINLDGFTYYNYTHNKEVSAN